MSQVSALRARIKTVATIHRTTSAMRLIAMSTQGRLKRQELILARYRAELKAIAAARTDDQLTTPPLSITDNESSTHPRPPLLIIAGSNKGLCGAFNEHLWRHVILHHPLTRSSEVITLGKPATGFVQDHGVTPLRTWQNVSIATYVATAHALSEYLLQFPGRDIIFISQVAKTFFIQQPRSTTVATPCMQPAALTSSSPDNDVQRTVNILLCRTKLTELIHRSLLAEQAARFLSMDTATRNAEEFLQQMRLDYNKLRQAAVTRELIELTSGL